MRQVARPVCCGSLWLILLFLAVQCFGWEGDVRALHQPLPGESAMVPWTIVLVGALSLAVLALLRTETWARVTATMLGIFVLTAVTALGLEYVLGSGPTPLDRFWLYDHLRQAGTLSGGRPTPHVLAAAGSYAVAVLAHGRKGRFAVWLTQVSAAGGLFCPAMGLIGYAYRLTNFGSAASLPHAGMAAPSAVSLLVVGLVILALYRDRGMFGLVSSRAFGGMLIRRVVAAVVVVPIIMGWFFYHGRTLSGATLDWFTAMAALLLIATYTSLLFWIGHLTDQHERATIVIAQQREQLIAELKDSIAEISELRSQLITICAWSSRIKSHGRWMTLEEFLDKELHLKISHGISDEALSELLTSVERDAWEKQEAVRDKLWNQATGQDSTTRQG